jgi:hypothetical protein
MSKADEERKEGTKQDEGRKEGRKAKWREEKGRQNGRKKRKEARKTRKGYTWDVDFDGSVVGVRQEVPNATCLRSHVTRHKGFVDLGVAGDAFHKAIAGRGLCAAVQLLREGQHHADLDHNVLYDLW